MRVSPFRVALGAILFLALGARVAYVVAQPAFDPGFDQPLLDGGYYLEWAGAIANGGPGPGGAFYLGPGYAYLLAAFVNVAGDRLGVLYFLQHALIVLAAGLLAASARRRVGAAAGLCTAALLLLYHPALFLASRPLSESAAVVSTAVALLLYVEGGGGVAAGRGSTWAAGLACGVGSVIRPNLLLVPIVWTVGELRRGRRIRAALLLLGVAVALLPVAARNLWISGHVVPVSSNAGITLYHGNGPGAGGGYTRPVGFSGGLAGQRQEATRLASSLSGRNLDPVEADRFWGLAALRERLSSPPESVALLAKKIVLSLSSAEISVGYAPGLDANPWRWAAPMPFGVILGLAVAGLILAGPRGTGGAAVWGAIFACAASLWIFYVSSRYRLPAAALLCVPAGAGVSLLTLPGGRSRRRRLAAGLVGVVVVAGSLLAPTFGVARVAEAVALSNRAVARDRAGDPEGAKLDLRAALERDRDSAPAWFNLGAVLERDGDSEQAEAAYRSALERDPAHGPSAGNLSAVLLLSGRATEAAELLEVVVARTPHDRTCWTNLIVARMTLGDSAAARAAAARATALGVTIDAGLLQAVGAPDPAGHP